MQLVECVPNFSEGRRQDVIERIVASMEGTTEVQILDVQTDVDHNRSVVSILGPPEAVQQAVFRGIASAAALIDMNHHRGGHPRMGATDVVPFVPVRGVSMEDCVVLARQLGERVGKELGIPVYLYEEAATRPDRHNLADVRRGEYEVMREEIGRDPDRAPDFGPATVGAAGAIAIGARPALVAFNVYLNTDDLEQAKAIARAIRHSSGGLRFVKALGLLVERRPQGLRLGQTAQEPPRQIQVSMNLTDYRQTPIHRVLELIRIEAARYGLSVTHSEIVGLLPAQALLDAAEFYLQLRGFSPDQILENRLSQGEGS
jgi:glutamate formiminotransferase